MRVTTALFIYFILTGCSGWLSSCSGEDILFEETFDHELSDKWKIVGLEKDDYRVRDGALELRVKPLKAKDPQPMLKVDLPFTTADTVVASVTVTVVGEQLNRGDVAGLCLTDRVGSSFSGRKTNIDGYFVLAPGEVGFIGTPGQEGDPGKYTVKYWPADEAFGPLRIIVRGHYRISKWDHLRMAITVLSFTPRFAKRTRDWDLAYSRPASLKADRDGCDSTISASSRTDSQLRRTRRSTRAADRADSEIKGAWPPPGYLGRSIARRFPLHLQECLTRHDSLDFAYHTVALRLSRLLVTRSFSSLL